MNHDVKPIIVMLAITVISFSSVLSIDSKREGQFVSVQMDSVDTKETIEFEQMLNKDEILSMDCSDDGLKTHKYEIEAEQETVNEAEPSLYLAFLKDKNGQIVAHSIFERLLNKDAAYFNKLYEYTVKEGNHCNYTVQFTNGDNDFHSARSNSQMITAMTSIYTETNHLTTMEEIIAYADWLWDASHKNYITFGEWYYCDEYCLDKHINNESVVEIMPTDSNADYAATSSDAATDIKVATDSNIATNSNSSARICGGHIDVFITSTNLTGQALFHAADKYPNPSVEWDGWDSEKRSLVDDLLEQDWENRYGILCSVKETRVPLTKTEISSYMEAADEEISDQIREVLKYALESVGKIPYYWGGKAYAKGYDGNGFGTVTEPDTENRIIRGLDCSGWLSWVYWSVVGERLPFESTQGLCTLGQGIKYEELRSGDIAIRTGEDSHVVMYLGTADDGTKLCIHESSYEGTVCVSNMSDDWDFYRRILN